MNHMIVRKTEDSDLKERSAVVLRPMRLRDVDRVVEIERASFRSPWPRKAFVHEVQYRGISFPVVAEAGGVVFGYILAWFVEDEVHIANIAVDPRQRGRGIGSALLEFVLEKGRREGYQLAYLEVRRSNHTAIRLYEKWGFGVIAVRRRYYEADGEDALVMAKNL
jgi:ribosomal-protein-alanine N-acetyltransferase